MTTIESRLTDIERRVRVYKIMIVALLVGLVAIVGVVGAIEYKRTAGVLEEIRAKKIAVVDDSGRSVVMLEPTDRGGRIYLRTSHEDDKSYLFLGFGAESEDRLVVTNSDGRPVAAVRAASRGGVFAASSGQESDKTLAWLGTTAALGDSADSAGAIFVAESGGKPLLTLTAVPGKGGLIAFFDSEGNPSRLISSDSNGDRVGGSRAGRPRSGGASAQHPCDKVPVAFLDFGEPSLRGLVDLLRKTGKDDEARDICQRLLDRLGIE